MLAGVLLSGFFFAHKVGQILRVKSVTEDEGRVCVYTISGQVFFASAERFINAFDYKEVIEKVCIDVSRAHFWDITAISALDKVIVKFRREATQVDVIGLNEASATMVDQFALRDKDDGRDMLVRQRYGELADTVVEQPQAVQLIVLGRRGEGAELSNRDVGRNVERVVRVLGRPLLTVTEKFTEPQRVMIAFDGGTAARQAVAMVASETLCQACRSLEAAGYQVHATLVPGEPDRSIAATIVEQRIDLLIMGAYSQSPLRSLLMRSTTSELLRFGQDFDPTAALANLV